MHEIERPLLVGRRVYPQRRTQAHAVLALLAAQRQAGFAIDPVHPLVVHLLAFTAQQRVQTPIAVARLLASQRDQTLARLLSFSRGL